MVLLFNACDLVGLNISQSEHTRFEIIKMLKQFFIVMLVNGILLSPHRLHGQNSLNDMNEILQIIESIPNTSPLLSESNIFSTNSANLLAESTDVIPSFESKKLCPMHTVSLLLIILIIYNFFKIQFYISIRMN